MFGDIQKKQEELKKQLATMTVEAEAGDGMVTITANGNREITNISIKPEAINTEDVEQLEDLLLVAINRAMEKAAQMEMDASQKLIQDMMPPGMEGLSDLMG